MLSKQQRFRHAVATFVHGCAVAAGMVRPPVEPGSLGPALPAGGVPLQWVWRRVPLDPEGIIALAGWMGRDEDQVQIVEWVERAGLVLLPGRLSWLQARLPADGLSDVRVRRRRVRWPVTAPGNVWLRARLAFGTTNARSAIATAVASNPASWHGVWQIAHEWRFCERATRDAARDLADAGLLEIGKQGTLRARFHPSLHPLRRPAPPLHARTWSKLIDFLVAADDIFGCADRDPLGLEEQVVGQGSDRHSGRELRDLRRLKAAASHASVLTVCDLPEIVDPFFGGDPMEPALVAVCDFLEQLRGW